MRRARGLQVGDVYANVMDSHDGKPGAVGDGRTDDTDAIQRAINTGLHVLFPFSLPNGYAIGNGTSSVLTFPNAGQRVTFQAGASIRLNSDAARVVITGTSQTFTGLWVFPGIRVSATTTTPAIPFVPDPCLLINGAHGLLLEDLRVSGTDAPTLVRIQNTVGADIVVGHIQGNYGQNIGLQIGDGVKKFSIVNLAIDHTAYGVVFSDPDNATPVAQNISFLDCDVEDQTENAMQVSTGSRVHGLSVIGMHHESNFAYRHVLVQAGAGVHGGVFAGCEFVQVNQDATTPGRVFVIDGDWIGVRTSGNYHHGVPGELANAHAVFQISPTSDLRQSADLFNAWNDVAVQTDSAANPAETRRLPMINSGFGTVTVKAGGVRFDVTKLGFFGATPVMRPGTYLLGPSFELHPPRSLATHSVREVLATLLRDLAALGLIRVG